MRATGRPRGGVSLKNMDRAALKRLVGYIMRRKGMLAAVLICIALSSIANVASSLFLQSLIDDYIAPLLLDAAPVFTGLLKAIVTMGCIYVVGILSSLCYNRLMATVAQSTLKDIRDDMFAHMQTLPLRYFDTHTHGDVMSYYTNDTDTLRQMISQSLPQVVSAAVTLVTVLVSMLSLSLYLTAFAILYVCLMLIVSRKIAARSGKYFVRQQKSIGDLNGYVEEMINGQRVVKVFCHEEAAEKDFDKRNEELCHNTSRANGYGNMLMPVMVSLSSLLYVSWPSSAARWPSRACPTSASAARARSRWAPSPRSCSFRAASPSPSTRFPSSSTAWSWPWRARGASSSSWTNPARATRATSPCKRTQTATAGSGCIPITTAP